MSKLRFLPKATSGFCFKPELHSRKLSSLELQALWVIGGGLLLEQMFAHVGYFILECICIITEVVIAHVLECINYTTHVGQCLYIERDADIYHVVNIQKKI